MANYDPSEIEVVDSHPICDYRPVIRHEYAALGFLEEYMGRRIQPESNESQWFFPNEREAAEAFTEHLRSLSDTLEVECEILTYRCDGGRTHIESPELRKVLDSHYDADFTSPSTALDRDGRSHPFVRSHLTMHSFLRDSPPHRILWDRMFSYILGAHTRYGSCSSMQIANALPKVALIHLILIELRRRSAARRGRGRPGSRERPGGGRGSRRRGRRGRPPTRDGCARGGCRRGRPMRPGASP